MIRKNKLFIATFIFLSFSTQVKAEEYAACKLLPDSQSAAYQAGVDVDGNAVVPADLNSNSMAGMMNVVKVPLEIDLAKKISSLKQAGIEMNAPLGMMEIHQDGKILYNGQDITSPMMTLCGESQRIVTDTVLIPPKPPEPPMIPVEPLPNRLEVTAEEAIEMPSVSAPVVEQPEPVQAPVITMQKISEPDTPLQPLTGTVKVKPTTNDTIKGQDFRDYNE